MDYNQNQQGFHKDPRQYYYQNSQMPSDKRSRTMTTAAVILSVAAISTVCCIYFSFICGILGIIFALLSKGGEMTMSPSAKTALWVSIMAIVLSVLLLVGSVVMLIVQYGSIDAFWKAYMEMVEAYSTAGMSTGN